MDKQWFYAIDDKQLGPVSNKDLVQKLSRGEISRETLIWSEGMTNWAPLSSMEEELHKSNKGIKSDQDLSVVPQTSPTKETKTESPSNASGWGWAVIILMAIFLVTVIIFQMSDSAQVTMVKKGTLRSCPNSTVERMVDSFMENPKWESGKTDNGMEYVNVEGGITFNEKPVTAKVQFLINMKNKTFTYNASQINEVPQNNFMAVALFTKMCKSVKD